MAKGRRYYRVKFQPRGVNYPIVLGGPNGWIDREEAELKLMGLDMSHVIWAVIEQRVASNWEEIS